VCALALSPVFVYDEYLCVVAAVHFQRTRIWPSFMSTTNSWIPL